MLLKFTAPDILNTCLIDVATGECAYDVSTILVGPAKDSESPPSTTFSQTTHEPQMYSRSSETMTSSPASVKQSHFRDSEETIEYHTRKTTITDALGAVVVDIFWKGRHPTFSICGEKVGALADLFGSSSVPFQPKILAIPTRFDTDYIWTGTPNSLTLFDCDTESARGTFHQNVFRLPAKSKGFKVKSSASFFDTSVSHPSLSPSCSTFFPAHVPNLGSNYLEFESHPLAHNVEIILSFLMMEILRRGRFNLVPYTFDKPKLWHFKEAKERLLARWRRHSV